MFSEFYDFTELMRKNETSTDFKFANLNDSLVFLGLKQDGGQLLGATMQHHCP